MTSVVAAGGVHRRPEADPASVTTLADEAVEWAHEWLQVPDSPTGDEPWRFTYEQLDFMSWFYAIDELGRFVYRRAVLRRMKGWGKDPLAAVIAAIEFVGPCRFAGWNSDGSPRAVQHPASWVQVAAVSKDQTRNTMTLFPGLFTRRAIDEWGIDIGKEIIYAERGRRRIEALTTSSRSQEGPRPTFGIENETEHWRKSNEGHAMHQVMERNIGKSRDGSARLLAVQNAHAPGEDSVAEWDWEAHQLGTPGLLYDSLEGPDVPHLGERAGDGSPLWDGDLLRASLDYARGDSYWVDVGRRAEEIEAPGALANTSRRFYLNQIAAGDERAFDLAVFQALYKERKLPEPGALVTLGFDGSRYGDHTALIATEVSTGYQWVAGYWEPVIVDPVAQPEIPVDDVMETVEFAFETWDVWMLLCDPSWWREQVATWQGRYNQPGQKRVEVINPLQKGRTAQRLLAYRRAMDEGELSHDGDARLQSAIGNAYREQLNSVDEEGEPLWVIQKERPASPLKIDAAAAGELSWWARLQAIAAGVLEVTEPGPAVYVPGWEEEKVRRGGSK